MWIFLLGVFLLIVVLFNIRIVSEKHCYVIERLGRYHTTWDSGLHVKVPLIDRIVAKLSLKEQVLDFPPQPVITKDNVTMQIDSVVYARIFEPKLYAYGVENPMSGLQNLTATTLRNIIGDMELDQTLTSRDEINRQMQIVLDKATDAWGIKVTRVEIKNINPPTEIEEAMSKQMRAERERRQTVLEAQAHKESVVSRAEGDKQALILQAEAKRDAEIALAKGQAEAIRIINEAEVIAARRLKEEGAADVVMKMKSIDALKDVSDGQATKIFIPNQLSDTLSLAAVFGEALQTNPKASTQPRTQYRQAVTNATAQKAVSEDSCISPESSAETRRTATTNYRQSHVLERK